MEGELLATSGMEPSDAGYFTGFAASLISTWPATMAWLRKASSSCSSAYIDTNRVSQEVRPALRTSVLLIVAKFRTHHIVHICKTHTGSGH